MSAVMGKALMFFLGRASLLEMGEPRLLVVTEKLRPSPGEWPVGAPGEFISACEAQLKALEPFINEKLSPLTSSLDKAWRASGGGPWMRGGGRGAKGVGGGPGAVDLGRGAIGKRPSGRDAGPYAL